jgi:hypothetical protein
MDGPWSLLTTEKVFTNPWIGNWTANRLGLHVGRILLFDLLDRVHRSFRSPLREDRGWIGELRREGVVAIPDFLPPPKFDVVQREVTGVLRDSLTRFAPRSNDRPGFGAKEPFGDIGFDRFDGGTLNRFVKLSAELTPATLETVRSQRFARLYRAAQGRPFPLSAVSLYYTRHGPQSVHDLQKDLHSDTFHSSIKLWYFTADVPPEAGPFEYVRGSHLSTARRLGWEYRRSLAARHHPLDCGGAFRITEEEVLELGYPAPTTMAVAANTLVIADTNGFHRRGPAEGGAERFAIYAAMRRSPFIPW